MKKTTEVWAFFTKDGDAEGLLGIKTDIGWTPLVCTNEDVLELLRPAAADIARETGKPVTLVKFTQREEVETYHGNWH